VAKPAPRADAGRTRRSASRGAWTKMSRHPLRSFQIASGPPEDGDGPDGEPGLWAGVVPYHSYFGAPEPDPAPAAGTVVPSHISALGTGTSAGASVAVAGARRD
jgi:hypothetical protein